MNKHIKTTGSILILAAFIAGLAFVMRGYYGAPAPQTQPSPASSVSEISIDNLPAGAPITLPYTVRGTVVGNWFFEGSFPVELSDASGKVLGTALAKTDADWMTTDRIPFTVALPAMNYHGPLIITFRKDNPSGEARFDASFAITVVVQ